MVLVVVYLTIVTLGAMLAWGRWRLTRNRLAPIRWFIASLPIGLTIPIVGPLNVSLINGYMPALGQTFNLFDWGSLVGSFSAINLPALAVGRAWNVAALYTTGVISVTPSFLEADFDENGTVNAADLGRWKTGFGALGAATHMQGDADGDLDVDGNDFLIWQRQLGSSRIVAATAPVPEPACGALLLALRGRR